MIFLFFIVLTFSFLILVLTYKGTKKNKIEKTIFIFIIITMSTFIYLHNTNYWIGKNIVEKVQNKLNIEDANKINPQDIYKIIISLESSLRDNPYNIDIIKRIAQAKYLLSDYTGALETYKLGRAINSNDIELLLGEANIRLFIEKGSLSKKTINLFKEVLEQDKNNLIGLLVLGDHSYNTNNVLHARKYYDKLL